ncbi:MAG: type III pantothenate kinase [Candidatus Delongbacteria bacterium]
MSFVIDAGNTLTKIYRIANDTITEECLYDISYLSERFNNTGPEDCIIASVVPQRTDLIIHEIKRSLNIVPFVIAHDHFKYLKSRYADIYQLGLDRLCNIAYALNSFKRNAVIIDLGSTVTFEIINDKGEFEGGMIFPGINMQIDSLAKKTAQLPRIDIRAPGALIGRSTSECISSGIFNGIAGICNDFVSKLRTEISKDINIVLSGGDAPLMSKLVNFEHKTEKHTVPLGAVIIREMNRK